jgi:23S rRNA (pseudouridine1915-N3)-methyltransferase
MNIKLICFGKMDEHSFREVLKFYQQKINKKVKLEIIELKEQSSADVKSNLRRNMELLNEQLVKFPHYEKIVFDVSGQLIDSLQFAEIIDKNKSFQNGNLLFVIGPSDGYDRKLIQPLTKISFGKVTYPHQLFRILALEQIYRSLKILDHEKYHK